jgi:DNA polymerase elongation subunit (family B)
VRKIQLKALKILAHANTPREFADRVPDVMKLVEDAKRDLRIGRVPLDELIVRQRLSRAIEAYKTPSPAARAARQLQSHGRQLFPGQSMEFLFARNLSGVHAVELGIPTDHQSINFKRYCRLLDRAIQSVVSSCESPGIHEQLLLWDFPKVLHSRLPK